MKIEVVNNISAIAKQDWQRLNRQPSVFSNYQFLQCLETSGSVSGAQGWQPHHLQLRDNDKNEINAILPMYVKSHSWGEYVFDWAWAEAYEKHNMPYYPKLVATTPFTPVTSHKLLSHHLGLADVFEVLTHHCQHKNLNSWHLLYCLPTQQKSDDVYQRNTVQFHWLNYNYRDFDDFLSRFTARKRKNTRKERLSMAQQNIEIRRVTGKDISEKELEFFYLTYQLTYLKRGHTPHLSFDFFKSIVEKLPEHILLIIANCNGEDIACAWFFFDDKHLYGRYWGCTKSYNNLHFELCYYQGIEFCIENKLSLFHPGTQGEHKIARGFEPKLTTSYHWIKHAGFKPAIKAFCLQEQQQMRTYQAQCQTLLPYKLNNENG
ncbi:N-acetyltransferase [Colwellia sp. MB02u-18]|uniref:GNAT family N-acetyltransferase n=1 Tax=unclassified Colwellia TaxID=196834 RepID=UPI0015F3EC84|nr:MULTISPECIES: GNAT family N-acetyltransferase [unclassified Colwellia]MBA6222576.1 N-acetyltransferase [Colwellia sp. MB3u-45]MBA6266251.1 N-acetyltransferase [Colwellia sp. MB3u-43]MBA6319633.1 N-acetyltransferase [Colwellia sp. MB02u-19]MBA6323300.1 N-acetyltransferase [Colwellia sp. MB02u-18]MBA6329600.1 N-acetyltransferase [Colwellia sp. MB02u-12]